MHPGAWTQMAHWLARSLYAPQGGGGDFIEFSRCMQDVFHSDGCGSPSRHHKLV